MNDLISIIMPVKNGKKYISEALQTIKKQNMNVEIIVVDDGSTDNTAEIAKSEGCKVLRYEVSEGQVKAKNKGLKAANGKYILFHDHDDVMNDGALKRLYDEISGDNSISAVQAMVKDYISPEIPEEEKQRTIIKQNPYYGLFTGAILIRKSAFDLTGDFKANVDTGEIIEWLGNMEKHNLKVKKIDFVSTNRRVHSSNFGKTHQKKEYKDYAAVLRAKIKRGANAGT